MLYLQPLLLLLIAVLAVFGVIRRNERRSRLITGASVTLLLLLSWEPAAYLSCGTLEWWYPVRQQPSGDAEAIIVLAGGAHKLIPAQPGSEANTDTLIRTRYAGWLYKHWRQLPIVVSGGESADGIVLAEVMRRILLEQGVPTSQIWIENRSHSTAENALYSAELLRGKKVSRIVLVTEAYHMLRAEKAFEHQGLSVVPAPCNFRYVQFHGEWSQFVPSPKAIEKNENCLHEWLALGAYWFTGKI